MSSVSELLERGLAALIEDELERIHAEGYETIDSADVRIWADLPWDEEGGRGEEED